MTVNEKIKKYIDERGFKQVAVARGIGMGEKTFNAILCGRSTIRVETLIKICKFLGVKSEIFLEN